MNAWLIIIIMMASLASLILIIMSFSSMIKYKNINIGLPIFFLGILISLEAAMKFINFENLVVSYIQTFFIAILFTWIIILLGGKYE